MAYVVRLISHHTVKVYADLEDHLVTIEDENHKVIKGWYVADIACHEVGWELEKLQEVYCVSQLDHAASIATMNATLVDQDQDTALT